MKIWLDGTLVESENAKLSVMDHGTLYGDGVFEGIRIYGGKIFQCQAHMDRLFASAEYIRLTIPFTQAELIDAMYECINVNGLDDGYIRLVVTRGSGTLGLNPFNCPKPSVFIVADQIKLFSPELYETGMAVIIAKTVRISPRMLNPKVKSLNYLNNTLAKIESIDAGVPEALMTNEDGNLAEGTGDNIFIVKNNVLITPPPEAGILLGITRGLTIHLTKKLGIEIREENFTPTELLDVEECFLTGTAAEIIPVTKVNGQPLSTGKVGPVTQKLMGTFHEFIKTDEQVPYSV